MERHPFIRLTPVEEGQACQFASARVSHGGCLPSSLTVHSGVAQGCPLSPVLYAVFVDGMLESVQTECADSGVRAGEAPLVLQASADDQAAASSTPIGLQRILDARKRYGDTGAAVLTQTRLTSSWWALWTWPLTLQGMTFSGAPNPSQRWTKFGTWAYGLPPPGAGTRTLPLHIGRVWELSTVGDQY
jgi:hypothetical protein